MINARNIPIGSLIKVKLMPIVLSNTQPLKMGNNGVSIQDLSQPLLVLDYNEGIDQIHGEFTRDIKTYFCVRLLVTADSKKFWVVVNSTSNTDAINLPEDMKDGFRETGKIELVELEND